MEGNEGGVGSSVNISGEPHLIIGILPASVRFGNDTPELYLPLVVTAASRLGSSLSVIARLSPGMQREAAEAELAVIAAQMRTAAGEASQMNPGVVPLQTEVTGDARSLLLPLFGAIGCVLLIGCATLANLLLARATLRRKEMAVRAALGAGRMRLIGQMLTESVALSLVGGIAALALTKCLLMLLVSVRPKGLPRIDEVSIDPYVLGFALVISLITGLLFGLAPALRNSQVDLEAALKEESQGSASLSRQWHRLQSSLRLEDRTQPSRHRRGLGGESPVSCKSRLSHRYGDSPASRPNVYRSGQPSGRAAGRHCKSDIRARISVWRRSDRQTSPSGSGESLVHDHWRL